MSRRRNSAGTNNQLIGIVAIIAVAVFVVGVIIIFAKSLFSGVEADIPKGLDTATVANAASQPAESSPADDSSEEEKKETKKSKETKATESSQAVPEGLGTKSVTEYAYLRKSPSPEGEQIICMSPGIQVTVLSEEDENGYVQASFDNNGTVLTGWVHGSYLA